MVKHSNAHSVLKAHFFSSSFHAAATVVIAINYCGTSNARKTQFSFIVVHQSLWLSFFIKKTEFPLALSIPGLTDQGDSILFHCGTADR